MKIQEARTIINECDAIIAPALARRMQAVKAIGEIKIAQNLPIKNPTREAEILSQIRKFGTAVEDIYKAIFEISYQIESKN